MRRRGRAFWQDLIREYETSGSESQGEFAARHGVKVQTFRGWLYRRRRGGDGARGPRLLPVRVVPSTVPTARWQGDAAVEAQMPSGVRVRFAAALGAELIADVLRRLG
jgi:hypothetical protein